MELDCSNLYSFQIFISLSILKYVLLKFGLITRLSVKRKHKFSKTLTSTCTSFFNPTKGDKSM